MEDPTPTTFSSSYDHAAALYTVARSVRSPVMTAVIARDTSVGDARSGDRDIQPPTAPSPTRKHERHGKGARNGLR